MSLQVSYPEPPLSKNFRVNKKTAHAIRVSGLFLITLPVILAVRQWHRHGDTAGHWHVHFMEILSLVNRDSTIPRARMEEWNARSSGAFSFRSG